jgi:hypothetical protein
MAWWTKGGGRDAAPRPGRTEMEKPAAGPQQQLQVQIDPQESEGIYSNFVLMANSPHEFFLDFARVLPGVPRAKVYARIILTPETVRSLLKTLEARVEAFETQYGKIRADGENTSTRDIGFKTT